MPPKTARKSTVSAPVKRGPRRLVRQSDKIEEKTSAEEKSEVKKDPISETKLEPIKETKKEMKETNEEKPSEKPDSPKWEEEKKEQEGKIEEKMDVGEEEYDPEEEITAVDYEPEETHEDEYIEEEIEVDNEEYPEEDEEPLEDEKDKKPLEDKNLLEDETKYQSSENLSLSSPSSSDGEDNEEQNKVVNEHRKRKEFEIFVGGLDKDANENDLRRAFNEAGEITEIRLLVNPITRKNKGFAFLRFATVEQAKRVVRDFRTPLICGRRCGVAASHDNDTLFVGNICKTWTKEHLKETLRGYGVDNFEELKLVDDPHNEGMNRGFAFLEFSSRDEALEVLKRLQKRDVNLGTDRIPKVAFSDSFKELDEEVMSQVTTVFIDHLPPAWDEDKIRKHLKKYGSIEKIELARNMPFAKRRDFGFVTFDTHENAISCINGISGTEIDDGDKLVKLKARLSRPTKKEHRPRHSTFARIRAMAPRMDRVHPVFPPPARRLGPPPRGPRHFGGPPLPRATLRVAPMTSGSRVVRRVVSTGLDRRALITVSERPRFRGPPPPSARARQERLPPPPPLPPPVRRPPPGYAKGSMKRERGERGDRERDYSSRHHHEELPLPPPPPPPPSRRPPARNNSYEDDYSAPRGPPPPPPAGYSSRGSDRRAFLEDDNYGRKHEGGGPRGGGTRDYDSVYGTKRPYSDIDDGPVRRNPRARMDYSSGSGGNNYTDSYGDRMERGPAAGYNSRNSLYSNRQGMSYAGGSGRASHIEDMYSSGLGGSYLSSEGGGGSYPSVYSNRGLGGGAGSSSYY